MKSLKWMMVCSSILFVYLVLLVTTSTKAVRDTTVKETVQHTTVEQDAPEDGFPVLNIGIQQYLYY
jgi:hypothetical protein